MTLLPKLSKEALRLIDQVTRRESGSASSPSPGSEAAGPLQSLFPHGRNVITLQEFAKLLMVSEQHVKNLIEELKLGAFDIAGGREVIAPFIEELARALNASPKAIHRALDSARKRTF